LRPGIQKHWTAPGYTKNGLGGEAMSLDRRLIDIAVDDHPVGRRYPVNKHEALFWDSPLISSLMSPVEGMYGSKK